MRIVIDISKDRYDEIMSMDWKNGRLIFDEEIIAIHDGKTIEQEPCEDAIDREAAVNACLNGWNKNYREIVADIRALPPVTPQESCEDCIRKQDEIRKAYDRGVKNGLIPKETCEDCISRQALLEEIENGINAGNYEEGYEEYAHINDMEDIIECIKYADSVQPKTDILDKIRAEIMDFEEDIFHSTKDYSDYAAVRHCVDIIDKYRGEVSE